ILAAKSHFGGGDKAQLLVKSTPIIGGVKDETVEVLLARPCNNFVHEKLCQSASAPLRFGEDVDDQSLATFRDCDLTVFVTNRKWRNFPHDDAGARDDFLGHITLTHQPAEIVSGSECFAQTIERFCPKRLHKPVRHQTHILEHAGAMPADYDSIVRIGLADLEFL